ncbi:hypothetical protein IH992_02910 [Candidatus Poribacteria bacterium]|nr:hypothetical protein [Candidatus Poribacteria bacterium]
MGESASSALHRTQIDEIANGFSTNECELIGQNLIQTEGEITDENRSGKGGIELMHSLRFLSILLLVCVIGSCRGMGGNAPKINTPPPLEETSRVVIAPFVTEEKAYELGHTVSLHLGTIFSSVLKETEWAYDGQKNLKPVTDKIKELSLTREEIFANPLAAAKVGNALEVDLIVVGEIKNLKLHDRDYPQPLKRVGKQAYHGISGTATYVRRRKGASATAQVRAINVKTGHLVFNGTVKGHVKYWYAWQTQQRVNISFVIETEMLCDLGRHLASRIAYMLYPLGVAEVKKGEVLLKPNVELWSEKGSRVRFD